MLNYIWAFMILVKVLWGAFHGNIGTMTQGALDSVGEAVMLYITMLGVIPLWTGVLEVDERAGLIRQLPRRTKPILHFLFPRVPEEHLANEHIAISMIANILDLGWAATPADLRVMEAPKDLEEERHTRKSRHVEHGTTSNEMCTFLIINISSLQLIPVNMIAYRSQYGSISPTAIVGPALITTLVSTVVGVILIELMDKS